MESVLFVDRNGESLHTCDRLGEIPKEDDFITINGTTYKVDRVETIITKTNIIKRVYLYTN
jgi:hypothetical protein